MTRLIERGFVSGVFVPLLDLALFLPRFITCWLLRSLQGLNEWSWRTDMEDKWLWRMTILARKNQGVQGGRMCSGRVAWCELMVYEGYET